ncbi:olfactory receptor 1496-like [Tachyglossus aculeatus]|uniref:olfactory receptor 1496-like n=1 Tax=Tachyglossus aculeatus TaxID=9261 RepID=UPI0018F5C3C7|nr:olfactory receptor 1496-like [Tachyglossus aculeatus]
MVLRSGAGSSLCCIPRLVFMGHRTTVNVHDTDQIYVRLQADMDPHHPDQDIDGVGIGIPVQEFFVGCPELQPVIFALILTMFLVNLSGNSLIITVGWTDPKLHIPIYLLLSQFSCVDKAFASITVPQFVVHTFSKHKAIPYGSCFVQMTFFLAVGNMEGYLLTTMSYDRYVAICSALYGIRLSLSSYCNNHILQFFCDIPSLVPLACPKPFLNDLEVFTEGIGVVISPLFFILDYYARIGAAVLSLRSTASLRKAMSTCGSHVLVLMLFYGTVIHLYFQPRGHSSLEQVRKVAIFYTVASPTLNPLICPLQNHDIQGTMRRLLRKGLRGPS